MISRISPSRAGRPTFSDSTTMRSWVLAVILTTSALLGRTQNIANRQPRAQAIRIVALILKTDQCQQTVAAGP